MSCGSEGPPAEADFNCGSRYVATKGLGKLSFRALPGGALRFATLAGAIALLLAAAGSMPIHAQMLTEGEFLADTLANHPQIAAAEAEIATASGVRRQAAVLANPEFAWEREDPGVAPSQDTWRLSWRLPFDGRQHRVAAADAAVAAARSELVGARLAVRLEMRALFGAWYLAAERAAVRQSHLERMRRLASWLRARAEEGEAAGIEVQRLALEVEVLRQDAATAHAEARARRAAAAAWSGLLSAAVTPARPPLPKPPTNADVRDRADLTALAHRAAQAEAQHRVQQRTLEPPEISAGWLKIRDGLQSFDGPVLAISWPLPVFDRNQGTRQAAAASAERARSELELARKRAAQDAHAALASYSELYNAVDSAGSNAETDVADIADVVDTVLAAFEAGEASLTDVLDTSRATHDVEIARLQLLEHTLAAERQLEAALGRPVPGGSL